MAMHGVDGKQGLAACRMDVPREQLLGTTQGASVCG